MVCRENVNHVGLAPSNYIRVNDEKYVEIENSELPTGWKSAIDKSTNDIYYYNKSTGMNINYRRRDYNITISK